MTVVNRKVGIVKRLMRSWLSKLLEKLASNDPAEVVRRVIETRHCDDCGAQVSRDIMSEDSVTYVCTNEKCGHKYEITGLQEELQQEASGEDV